MKSLPSAWLFLVGCLVHAPSFATGEFNVFGLTLDLPSQIRFCSRDELAANSFVSVCLGSATRSDANQMCRFELDLPANKPSFLQEGSYFFTRKDKVVAIYLKTLGNGHRQEILDFVKKTFGVGEPSVKWGLVMAEPRPAWGAAWILPNRRIELHLGLDHDDGTLVISSDQMPLFVD